MLNRTAFVISGGRGGGEREARWGQGARGGGIRALYSTMACGLWITTGDIYIYIYIERERERERERGSRE